MIFLTLVSNLDFDVSFKALDVAEIANNGAIGEANYLRTLLINLFSDTGTVSNGVNTSSSIKSVTKEEAKNIIRTGKPLGVFYRKEGSKWVGIDNSNGNAIVEEFDDTDTLARWLNGELESIEL